MPWLYSLIAKQEQQKEPEYFWKQTFSDEFQLFPECM